MANTLLRNEALRVVAGAVHAARDARAVNHHGLRGRVRELALGGIIQPFLPGGFEVATGIIVDAEDRQSAQTDGIIYNRRVLPPFLISQVEGVFPIEACFYSVEVKSVLTARELEDTLDKARTLATLRYLPGHYVNGRRVPHPLNPVVPVLFAFDSDLRADAEIERYQRIHPAWRTERLIRAICVVGKGYWFFGGPDPERWQRMAPTPAHDEVVCLVGGIANTLPDSLAARGNPRYGNYIQLPNTFVDME
jgi:hypothetical protein